MITRKRMYLISCGGTGGHLAPGIALAEELTVRGYRVTLLISEKPVDARLAAKYPALRFQTIPGAPFSLRPDRLRRFFVQQARGLWTSFRLVRSLRPAAIIGFGGFTTAAIILIGAVSGVPLALHEANRVPGRAIRLMALLADRVYLPPGVSVASAGAGCARAVGLPVRNEIQRQSRAEAHAAFGLDPLRRTVVVLGGSQGATALNDWARAAAPALAHLGVQVCWVTGAGKGDTARVEHPGSDGRPVVALSIPFCDRMATLLSTADLAVSRAGAGTIAELVRCQTPAILVPYPFAADNHQAANASFFEQQGGGFVIEQAAVATLTEEVQRVVVDDELLDTFRRNLRRLDRADARATIVEDLDQLFDARRTAPPFGAGVSTA